MTATSRIGPGVYHAAVRDAVIVANAPWRWNEGFVRLVRAASLVLAADGGANHLARIGVRPEAVIGDFDSLSPDVRAWVGEERLVARPDQERTDLEKTLTYAFDERGVERITVLAGTGGRLDHALGNLGLLARFGRCGEIEMRDECGRIVPVEGHSVLAARPGQVVSLLPLGRCERVTTAGLRWPLVSEALDLGGRGISNVAERDQIELTVAGGTLLVFLAEALNC